MIGLLLLGVAQGFRHAIEPDHLAAVAVIAGERPHASQDAAIASRMAWGARVGAFWGLGHALSLAVFAGGLAAVGLLMPEAWETTLERVVGIVLIGLGARALHRAVRQENDHVHEHGHENEHENGHGHEHVHVGTLTIALRPFLVGIVHGLAGSGALTAALIAAVPGSAMRVLAALAFGLGATLGMTAISGAAGAGLGRTSRDPRVGRAIGGVSGAVSLGLGVTWVIL